MAKDITFRILAQDLASPAFKSVARSAEEAGLKIDAVGKNSTGFSSLSKFAAGAALAIGAAAVASVKMAAQFNSSMEKLHTQAGVSQDAIKGLSDGVLNLAGKVGFGPTSLSEALYHIESTFSKTGLSGAKAMELLKTAADGAAVGGSNLVDTTNALDAVIVSGISGVKSYDQAMGALNATVGTGDMTMQDLSEALGTGVTAVVKGFGVTLSDVSAALAVFGDNNIRGADAGTALRMSVMALAKPAVEGAKNLESLGLSTSSLAKDMQNGGLNTALVDLVTHMNQAGITGNKVGQFLTDTFGKKAGVGINILVTQLGLLQNAYADVDRHQHSFAEDVAANQKTLSQQWKDFTSGLQAGMVKVGNALTPIAEDGLHALSTLGGGLGTVAHALYGMRQELTSAAITAGVLWGVFRGGPQLFAAVSSGLETLALKAMYVGDALKGLSGGSALMGGVMAGAAAGGVFLLTNGLMSYFRGASQARQVTDQVNTALAKTPFSVTAYSNAIDTLKSKISGLHQTGGISEVFGLFTGSTENAAGQIDVYQSKIAGLNKTLMQTGERQQILAEQLANSNTKFGVGAGASAVQKYQDAITQLADHGLLDLNQSFDQNMATVKAYMAVQAQGAPAADAMAAALTAEGDNSLNASDKIKVLIAAMNALAGTQQTLLGDQIAANSAIQDFAKNIPAASRSLDVNTDAGRANLTVLNQAAGAVEKYAQDQLQAGTPLKTVNGYIFGQAVALEATMVKMGFSKAVADGYIKKLLQTPKDVTTQVNLPGGAAADQTIRNLNRDLDNTPDHRTITLTAIDNASSVLSSIRAMEANINPNIPITATGYANLSKLTSPQFHAAGGIASGWSWVGERGPELIHVGSPSRVLTASESAAVSGGTTVVINGPVYTDKAGITRLTRQIIDEISREKDRGSSMPSNLNL